MVETTKSQMHFQSASEAYGSGNSDKLCDFIADSILNACLTLDPLAKVEIDVAAKSNLIVVLGEIQIQ